MAEAYETLTDALRLYEECKERVVDFERAVQMFEKDVSCRLIATQGGSRVGLSVAVAVCRPLFEAALIAERQSQARMLIQLDAARTAMQTAGT